MRIPQWNLLEIPLTGSVRENPFTETTLTATFTQGGRAVRVTGFCDGGTAFKVRFMPDTPGEWAYVTASNDPLLDGQRGTLTCETAEPGVHGPIYAQDMRFAYADGTPYFPVGTTCYVWNHQPRALREQTIETLRHAPFNKMRMCLFPKSYSYNHNAPESYAFLGDEASGFDFTRMNPAYWALLEECILALQAQGIECDLILLHPYDRWGFATMPAETDDFVLRYAVARLSAYRNVWWSMANEYDLMKAKTPADWRRMGELIQAEDPYGHLRSIHNCRGFYDHSEPWVTHCSVQSSRLYELPQWRAQYQKPVVIDEMCYEGNIPFHWGCISAVEMTRRCWQLVMSGGYIGHGETYYNDREELWWSKGGELIGESPARIQFLLDMIADMPPEAQPINPDNPTSQRNLFGVAGQWYLHDATGFQPSSYNIELPEGQYEATVIDTWAMTATPAGTHSGTASIALPQREGMVVKIKRADA